MDKPKNFVGLWIPKEEPKKETKKQAEPKEEKPKT